jgi:hypothetical protein
MYRWAQRVTQSVIFVWDLNSSTRRPKACWREMLERAVLEK